jgi:hypothetical protein
MNDIIQLQENLGRLGQRDQQFANSLIADFNRYGRLTPGQQPWVGKLIERATAPRPEPTRIDVGTMAGVIALFRRAQEHLKHPKIVLQCGTFPVTLSLAGSASKAPGSINVMGEGQYPNREWFGRISPEGQFEPSGSLLREQGRLDAIQALLVSLGVDPAGVAKKHGALTGSCCFCNRKLTDAKSVAAGFGPVCADNYGLTAEWKSAVAKQVETVEAQ